MYFVAALSVTLAVIAAYLTSVWRGGAFAAPRRSGEHWTERRARAARMRAARKGAITLGSAAVLLQGLALLLR